MGYIYSKIPSKTNEYKAVCNNCHSISTGYSKESPWEQCSFCDGDMEGFWILDPNRQLEFNLDEIW